MTETKADASRFGTATKIIGGGTFESPLAQSDGSKSKSYLVTDYSKSYDKFGLTKNQTGPEAKGWSWAFDGTAIETTSDGTVTNFGYTKSDIYQKFNSTIWSNTGVARQETVINRSYSSNSACGGTYDSPISSIDGSYNRGYSTTDYSHSYDVNGKPVAIAPTVDGWSYSYDGVQKTYTEAIITQTFNLALWVNLGKTMLLTTVTDSWSSMDDKGTISRMRNDAAAFGTATKWYGGGSMDDPVTQKDSQRFRSHVVMDYAGSYDENTSLPTAAAPKATGWNWTDSGIGEGANIGITKTDIEQTFRSDIWQQTGLARLQEALSWSYSSNDVKVGGTLGVDINYGEGSFETPKAQDNGTWFRGFSRVDYSNSYLISGKLNTANPPVTKENWSLSFDGTNRYTKSITSEQTANQTVWANTGRVVPTATETYSFSSDNERLDADRHHPNWGSGTYWTPVIRTSDHTYERSYSKTDYSKSYDNVGRTTSIAPTNTDVTSESGDIWKKSEFTSQADMDQTISTLSSILDGYTAPPALSATELENERILRDDPTYTPVWGFDKTSLLSELTQWAASHTAADTTYEEFVDFAISWLDHFPTLDQWEEWRTPSYFQVQHNLISTLYRSSESGGNQRFIDYAKGVLTGFTDATIQSSVTALLNSGGTDLTAVLNGLAKAFSTATDASDLAVIKTFSDGVFDFSDLTMTETNFSWRNFSHTITDQTYANSAWKEYGQMRLLSRTSDTRSQSADGSTSRNQLAVTFTMDPTTFKQTGGTGTGTIESTDSAGNQQTQTYTQNYGVVVLGEAKLTKQTITSQTGSAGKDGSTVSLIPGSVNETTFGYDQYGRLNAQTSTSGIRTNDGWGNITDAITQTVYTFVEWVAKVDHTIMTTTTQSKDGTVTTSGPVTTYYDYADGGKGLLYQTRTDASDSTTTKGGRFLESTHTDAYVTLYKIFAGQARAYKTDITSTVTSFDGSKQTTQVVTYNRIKASGMLPDSGMIASTSVGSIHGTDAYNNPTVGETAGGRGVYREARNFAGQVKGVSNLTISKTTYIDDSWDDSSNLVVSHYDSNGVLQGGTGRRTGRRDDGNGNIDINMGTDTYESVFGLLKIKKSDSTSLSAPLNLSYSWSNTIVNYTYSAGVLTAATGSGTTKSNDGWGNIAKGTLSQIYEINWAGQAKNTKTTTDNTLNNVNGSYTTSHMETTTTYNVNTGLSETQNATGHSNTNDGVGNLSWEDSITQTFVFNSGLFKLGTSESTGGYQRLDNSKGESLTKTFYDYDGKFKISGVRGGLSFWIQAADGSLTTISNVNTIQRSWEQWGNGDWNSHSISYTVNDYGLYAGSALVTKSTTQTIKGTFQGAVLNMIAKDGSSETRTTIQHFSYTSGGRLSGSYSDFTFSGGQRPASGNGYLDYFATWSEGEGHTDYVIAFGQAVESHSTGGTSTGSDRQDSYSNSTESTTYDYTYDLTVPELSAKALRWFNNYKDVFNDKGEVHDKFRAVKNVAQFSNSSLSNGVVTSESGGSRTTWISSQSNMVSQVDEFANVGVDDYRGLYEDSSNGTRTAQYIYSATTGIFQSGWSQTTLNINQHEIGTYAYISGTSVSINTYGNLAGKQVVTGSTSETTRNVSVLGETIQTTISSDSTFFTYNTNTGNVLSSIRTTNGWTYDYDSGYQISISHSISNTYSSNMWGVLDAVQSVTNSESWDYVSGSHQIEGSITNRSWGRYGEVEAWGTFTSAVEYYVFNNDNGTANGFYGGHYTSPEYSEGTNYFGIFGGSGTFGIQYGNHKGANGFVWREEQITSSYCKSQSQDIAGVQMFETWTTYHRNSNGSGVWAEIKTHSYNSDNPWWSWTYTVQDYFCNDRFLTQSIQVEEVTPLSLSELDKPVALYITSTRYYSYGAPGKLQSVNSVIGDCYVVFDSRGQATYTSANALAEGIAGDGVKKGAMDGYEYETLPENQRIYVTYAEEWDVTSVGHAPVLKSKEYSLGFRGFSSNTYLFKGDHINIYKKTENSYDSSLPAVLTSVKEEEIVERISTYQYAFNADPSLIGDGAFYIYSGSRTGGMVLKDGQVQKFADGYQAMSDEEEIHITHKVSDSDPNAYDTGMKYVAWYTDAGYSREPQVTKETTNGWVNMGARVYWRMWSFLGNYGFETRGNVRVPIVQEYGIDPLAQGHGVNLPDPTWDPIYLRKGEEFDRSLSDDGVSSSIWGEHISKSGGSDGLTNDDQSPFWDESEGSDYESQSPQESPGELGPRRTRPDVKEKTDSRIKDRREPDKKNEIKKPPSKGNQRRPETLANPSQNKGKPVSEERRTAVSQREGARSQIREDKATSFSNEMSSLGSFVSLLLGGEGFQSKEAKADRAIESPSLLRPFVSLVIGVMSVLPASRSPKIKEGETRISQKPMAQTRGAASGASLAWGAFKGFVSGVSRLAAAALGLGRLSLGPTTPSRTGFAVPTAPKHQQNLDAARAKNLLSNKLVGFTPTSQFQQSKDLVRAALGFRVTSDGRKVQMANGRAVAPGALQRPAAEGGRMANKNKEMAPQANAGHGPRLQGENQVNPMPQVRNQDRANGPDKNKAAAGPARQDDARVQLAPNVRHAAQAGQPLTFLGVKRVDGRVVQMAVSLHVRQGQLELRDEQGKFDGQIAVPDNNRKGFTFVQVEGGALITKTDLKKYSPVVAASLSRAVQAQAGRSDLFVVQLSRANGDKVLRVVQIKPTEEGLQVRYVKAGERVILDGRELKGAGISVFGPRGEMKLKSDSAKSGDRFFKIQGDHDSAVSLMQDLSRYIKPSMEPGVDQFIVLSRSGAVTVAEVDVKKSSVRINNLDAGRVTLISPRFGVLDGRATTRGIMKVMGPSSGVVFLRIQNQFLNSVAAKALAPAFQFMNQKMATGVHALTTGMAQLISGKKPLALRDLLLTSGTSIGQMLEKGFLGDKRTQKDVGQQVTILLKSIAGFGEYLFQSSKKTAGALGQLLQPVRVPEAVRTVNIDAEPLLGVDLFVSGQDLKQLFMTNRSGFLSLMIKGVTALQGTYGRSLPANYLNTMIRSFSNRFQRDYGNTPEWFNDSFVALVWELGNHVPQVACVGRDGKMWTPDSGFSQLVTRNVPLPQPVNPNILAQPFPQNPQNFRMGIVVPNRTIDLNRSYSVERRFTMESAKIQEGVASTFHLSPAHLSSLSRLSSKTEQAGVILIGPRAPGVVPTRVVPTGLVPTGLKVFNAVSLDSRGAAWPSDRQMQFVQEVNAVWNDGLSRSEVRSRLNEVMRRYPDVTRDIDNPAGSDLLSVLLGAEAFSTQAGVLVLEKSYRSLSGAFIPFHTHLGHPGSFHGAARFAPTAADVRAHRHLMTTLPGGSLSLPGAILHTSGDITLFTVGESDAAPIRLWVRSASGEVSEAFSFVKDLEQASVSGELALVLMDEGCSRLVGAWRALPAKDTGAKIDLWDQKRGRCAAIKKRYAFSGKYR